MKQRHESLPLLDDPRLKQPYGQVPDGYWTALEDAVHRQIHAPVVEEIPLTWWDRVKSFVFLALSFCIILGFGYGVMWLTDTSSTSDYGEDMDLSALLDEGYLQTYWIEYHYEELFSEGNFTFEDDPLLRDYVESDIDLNLTEQEILEYLYE